MITTRLKGTTQKWEPMIFQYSLDRAELRQVEDDEADPKEVHRSRNCFTATRRALAADDACGAICSLGAMHFEWQVQHLPGSILKLLASQEPIVSDFNGVKTISRGSVGPCVHRIYTPRAQGKRLFVSIEILFALLVRSGADPRDVRDRMFREGGFSLASAISGAWVQEAEKDETIDCIGRGIVSAASIAPRQSTRS